VDDLVDRGILNALEEHGSCDRPPPRQLPRGLFGLQTPRHASMDAPPAAPSARHRGVLRARRFRGSTGCSTNTRPDFGERRYFVPTRWALSSRGASGDARRRLPWAAHCPVGLVRAGAVPPPILLQGSLYCLQEGNIYILVFAVRHGGGGVQMDETSHGTQQHLRVQMDDTAGFDNRFPYWARVRYQQLAANRNVLAKS